MNQNIFKPLNNGWHQEKIPFFSFSKHDYFLLKKNTSWTCQQLHHKAIWQNAFASTSSSTLQFYINTCTQIQYKTLISTCCAKHIIILIHKKVTTVTVLTLTQSLKLLHHTHNITPSENKHFATHEFHGELSQAFNMTFSWVIFRWSEFHYMLNETKFYK